MNNRPAASSQQAPQAVENTKTVKEEHEEKLLSCIDIPYFKNNPAYIDLWRSYFREFKNPQVLFLMYHKQISTFFHWIHIEISQYFLNRKLPQLAHFILEEAIHNKVFDQEKLKEALSRIPPFDKKYSRGDMLAVLNIKNIKCFGKMWNSYSEELFYIKNLPVEFCTFEQLAISKYENVVTKKGFIAKTKSLAIKSDNENKVLSIANNELISSIDYWNKISSIDDETIKKEKGFQMNEEAHNEFPTRNHYSMPELKIGETDGGFHLNGETDKSFDKLANEINLKYSTVPVQKPNDYEIRETMNLSKNDNISKQIEYDGIKGNDENSSFNQAMKESNDDNAENRVVCDLSLIVEKELFDQGFSEEIVSSMLEPQNEEFCKKIKLHNVPEISTLEISGELELNSELIIDGYVYFVQSVGKNWFSLLKIAKLEDITQTMMGKSFMLARSDINSLKIAKESMGYEICHHEASHYILYDFVSLLALDFFISDCNTEVKAFYLRKIVEKLIVLKENSVMISSPLDFLVDQDFDLGFGSFILNQTPIDQTIQCLKQVFHEFDISISFAFMSTLQSIVDKPESKKLILKHKTELLQLL